MKFWKLMLSAIIVSVFMLRACIAIDGTVQAEDLSATANYENTVNYN